VRERMKTIINPEPGINSSLDSSSPFRFGIRIRVPTRDEAALNTLQKHLMMPKGAVITKVDAHAKMQRSQGWILTQGAAILSCLDSQAIGFSQE
ncbi:10266_t:CDS:2, partial [Scutellospora calospora]